MRIVQLRKAEQSHSEFPLAIVLFYPRSGHCEVSITVGGLPCVARYTYLSLYRLALKKNKYKADLELVESCLRSSGRTGISSVAWMYR